MMYVTWEWVCSLPSRGSMQKYFCVFVLFSSHLSMDRFHGNVLVSEVGNLPMSNVFDACADQQPPHVDQSGAKFKRYWNVVSSFFGFFFVVWNGQPKCDFSPVKGFLPFRVLSLHGIYAGGLGCHCPPASNVCRSPSPFRPPAFPLTLRDGIHGLPCSFQSCSVSGPEQMPVLSLSEHVSETTIPNEVLPARDKSV